MERKRMVKAKGKWVVLSSSILASAVALNMAAPVAHAEASVTEADLAPVSEQAEVSEVGNDAVAPLVIEVSVSDLQDEETTDLSEVDELVESIVEDVVAQDEVLSENDSEDLTESTDTELETDIELETEVVPELEGSIESDIEVPVELETEAVPQTMRMVATAAADTSYNIKYGDTLWSIANRHGVTVSQLKNWNNLTSDFIHTGNNLVVGRQNSTPAPTNPTPTPVPTNPTPTPAPTPAPTSTHTVKSGEYLYLIASRYGVTVNQLVKWNNLSSNYIYSGNKLIVTNPTVTTPADPKPEPKPETPAPKPETPAPKPETPAPKPETPTPAPQETYTVKPGDSLWLIANKHGVTINQLKSWNNLSSNWIYSGTVFKVANPATPAPKPETPKPETPKPETPKPETPKPETPTPETPKPETPKPTPTYTVKSGDSLWQIANKHGVTINQLKQWNKLSSNWIYTGNVFYLSDPAQPAPTPVPTPEPKPEPKPETPVTPPVSGDKDEVSSEMDIKINGLKQQFYVGTDITTGKLVEAKTYFGQKFSVLSQVKDASGKTFYELAQNGRVIGFVESSAVVEVPVGKTVVYLDAGHGGAETGAYSGGTAEKNLNLNISLQVAQRLRDQGYIVHESRTSDKEIKLHDRTKEPNSLMPDIYVSIHHNAMPASYGGRVRGIVTLYHDSSIDEKGYPTLEHDNAQRIADSRRLAQLLNDGMVKETGTPYDMGIRPQNLHVTRTNYVPAALVELGFMDNYTELQNLKNTTYQQKLIGGLVKGINQFFGR